MSRLVVKKLLRFYLRLEQHLSLEEGRAIERNRKAKDASWHWCHMYRNSRLYVSYLVTSINYIFIYRRALTPVIAYFFVFLYVSFYLLLIYGNGIVIIKVSIFGCHCVVVAVLLSCFSVFRTVSSVLENHSCPTCRHDSKSTLLSL